MSAILRSGVVAIGWNIYIDGVDPPSAAPRRSELSCGGYSVWAKLPGRVADSFCEHAATQGVLVSSCASFSVCNNGATHIRIPFTADPPILREGVRRLADAWSTFDRTAQQSVVV